MKMCLLQVRLRILYRVSIPGIVRTICSFPPILSQLVPTAGLEPARLSTLHSECSTSAYSDTRAYFGNEENIVSQQFATRIENFSLAIRYQGLWAALLVGIVGLEPTRYHYHRILSPTRLPIPPYTHIKRILGVCSPTQQLHWRFGITATNQLNRLMYVKRPRQGCSQFTHESQSERFQARPTTTFLALGRIDYSPYP